MILPPSLTFHFPHRLQLKDFPITLHHVKILYYNNPLHHDMLCYQEKFSQTAQTRNGAFVTASNNTKMNRWRQNKRLPCYAVYWKSIRQGPPPTERKTEWLVSQSSAECYQVQLLIIRQIRCKEFIMVSIIISNGVHNLLSATYSKQLVYYGSTMY